MSIKWKPIGSVIKASEEKLFNEIKTKAIVSLVNSPDYGKAKVKLRIRSLGRLNYEQKLRLIEYISECLPYHNTEYSVVVLGLGNNVKTLIFVKGKLNG